MAQKPALGFIGIGIMGEAMVLRLLDQGFAVTVWNLTPDRYANVIAAGARRAESPAAVAAASEIVLMCVLDAPAVENCCFGENGLATAQGGGKIVVDHSTINPDATRAFVARLQRQVPLRWVDAPVSGGPLAAREGTLTIMAGGEPSDIETAAPVMAALAAHFTHIGALGAGQTAKILNQAIVGAGYVLMAEALALAEAAGLDAAKLPECLAGGHADSNLLRRLYPQMCARDFEPPRAYARQLLKDMKNVRQFAGEVGVALPLVERAVERFDEFVAAGNAMKDPATIALFYHRRADGPAR